MRELWLVLLVMGGCGGIDVQPLDIHDPRLPRSDRLFLADAEDAVVVARANVAEADAVRAEVERWRARRAEAGSLGAADGPLDEMASARARLAGLEHEAAQADADLARARLALAYAQTAVRRDLAVYDLPPVEAATEAAAARAAQSHEAADSARVVLEEATGRFWTAYRGMAAGGGDTRPLWKD